MIGYHVTTIRKLKRYELTGAILPPVRFWPNLFTAEKWAKKTGRGIILEIGYNQSYPLPDHKPARWTPELIRAWNSIRCHRSGLIAVTLGCFLAVLSSEFSAPTTKSLTAAIEIHTPPRAGLPATAEGHVFNVARRWGTYETQIQINGRMLTATIDTGASHVVLPFSVARGLPRPLTWAPGVQDGVLADGTQVKQRGGKGDIRWGPFMVRDVEVSVLVNDSGDEHASVLLGQSFLEHFVLQLDPSQDRITVMEYDRLITRLDLE